MFVKFIGITAACLTMFGFFPQIGKALKTKSTKDMSIFTLFQLSLGVSLWVIYGVSQRDPIIITANAVTLATLIALIVLYFYYR